MIMKNYLPIVFSLLFALGCKKGNVIPKAGLTGKWELRIASGGISGATRNYAAGNGNTYSLMPIVLLSNIKTFTW